MGNPQGCIDYAAQGKTAGWESGSLQGEKTDVITSTG